MGLPLVGGVPYLLNAWAVLPLFVLHNVLGGQKEKPALSDRLSLKIRVKDYFLTIRF